MIIKKPAALWILVSLIFFACNLNLDWLGNVWSPQDPYRVEDYPRLVKKNGEDFRILQFTDTHLNAYYSSFDNIKNTIRMMEDAVRNEKPDLLVLTGDNVGNFINSHWAWQLISCLDSFAIPYALVMGNHDGDFIKMQDDNQQRVIAEILSRGAYSLFTSGPDNLTGTGNYGLHIVNQTGEIIYDLILMDSNDDYIGRDQVEWYEWYVRGLNNAVPSGVKNLLFFHIPLPEIEDIKREMELNNYLDRDGRSAKDAFGESPLEQKRNTGLFAAVKTLGDTTHLFFGHDHENILIYDYQGVWFVYGLKTGYCGYYNSNRLGAVLITLSGDDTTTAAIDVNYRHLK
ncbi:MAG: metallophosphoesterase [Spirochaetaceae bacterium]|jgi:predicted MPP superfamily phosphohydrolase|nr:metallophosphoesterase [Spirochaetaceae bacterium]